MNTIYTITGKGGSGKSTTVKYLALVLAAAGNEVILIDTDPQASLTRFVMGDDFIPEKSLSDLLLGAASLDEVMIAVEGVKLIPCTGELENTAIDLAKRESNIHRLRSFTDTLPASVIIDTLPKTFDYLTEMAAAASDYVIAVVHPDREAIRKVTEAKELAESWQQYGRGSRYLGFIGTQLSTQSAEQRQLTEELQNRPDFLGGVWFNRSQRKHQAYLRDYAVIAEKIGHAS